MEDKEVPKKRKRRRRKKETKTVNHVDLPKMSYHTRLQKFYTRHRRSVYEKRDDWVKYKNIGSKQMISENVFVEHLKESENSSDDASKKLNGSLLEILKNSRRRSSLENNIFQPKGMVPHWLKGKILKHRKNDCRTNVIPPKKGCQSFSMKYIDDSYGNEKVTISKIKPIE